MNSFIFMHILDFPIIFWGVFVFPVCFGTNTLQWYDTCGTNFTCGNVSVGFPFWGDNTRPKNCGYPDFELTCEDNTTKLVMRNITYHVMEVNQATKVLRIVRDDFLQGLCLQKFVNTTLNSEFFDHAGTSQNITVFYGCPSPSTSTSVPAQFSCRINGVTNTIGTYQVGVSGPSGCYASVVVPIIALQEPQILNNSVGLSHVIDQGFYVSYKVQDDALCSACGASHGRCGFDYYQMNASCICSDGSFGYYPCSSISNFKPSANSGSSSHKFHKILAVILVCSAVGLGIFVLLALYFRRAKTFSRRYLTDSQEIEDFLIKYGPLAVKRYTYKGLKKITSSFIEKLGEGGYGTVYKGKLLNGDQVAIKILKESKGNAEDFINEVSSIGRTNHVNVVTLLGFCFEGQRRALVYDYMANGSLDKLIDAKNNHQPLSSKKLFQIAVGIARGLEYLHRGCNTRIVHFDIKPHNILLDENFCPKISDFGLAKSSQKNDSILSLSVARGTVGFIAPELIFRSFGDVSHKSDVYSYGMLVLEMVGCRQNVMAEDQQSSEQYFPHYVYKQLEQTEEVDHQGILNEDEVPDWRKMIIVSLWCTQTNPSSRPAMSRVVEMLEGPLDSLQIPPMSYLSFPSLTQPGFSTVTTVTL